MEFFLEITRECWVMIHGGGWPELGWWSYVLLVLLVATEGPVSTLVGAAAAATGILDIRYVFASAFLGNVLGDTLWYSVGYVSDLKRIHRYGSWFGLRNHHVDRLEHEMHCHATKLIALSKLAIGLIIPTLVAAGLARVPWRRWFPLVLTIEVVWTLLMVNLGYHGAGLITQMERGLQLIGVVVLTALIIAVIWYGRRFFTQKEAAMAEITTTEHVRNDLPFTVLNDTVLNGEPSALHATPSRWHLGEHPDRGVALRSPYRLHRRLTVKRPTCAKRTAYKQMLCRFTATKLSTAHLTRQSLAARSVMTRAMAEGKNLLSLLATANSSSYTPEVHFAGD